MPTSSSSPSTRSAIFLSDPWNGRLEMSRTNSTTFSP